MKILKKTIDEDVWEHCRFIELRGRNGRLKFLSFDERGELLSEMPLTDVKGQRTIKVPDLK